MSNCEVTIELEASNKNNVLDFNQQYPHIYTTTVRSSGLFRSIIKWIFSSIISAAFVVILYPLLIPSYIIVIIHWIFKISSNTRRRNGVNGHYSGCALCPKFLDLISCMILLLIALILAPVSYIIFYNNPNITISVSFALIPSILFFTFRRSVLLRLSRWHLRGIKSSKNITLDFVKAMFPQWFVTYFIDKLKLHYLLITNYNEDDIYLLFHDKFQGMFSLNKTKINVDRFILDFKFAVNFYDTEDVVYRRILCGIVVIFPLMIPFILYNNTIDLIIDIILSFGVLFILGAIYLEIEGRLIFALLKYLDCMRQFGELLCINPLEKKNRKKTKGCIQRKRFAEDMAHGVEAASNCDDIIKLHEGYNVNVWINNWLMMYNEADKYFDRYQYILYSLIVSVVIAVFIMGYNIFMYNTRNDLFNHIFVTGVGVLSVLLIWSQLLIISFKFSSLEKKHIRLLLNQKIWIKQMIFELSLGNNDHVKYEIFHLEKCVGLLHDLLQKMQINGLSPKIGGIPINKAFVQLTWSLIISIVTASISFYLRNAAN